MQLAAVWELRLAVFKKCSSLRAGWAGSGAGRASVAAHCTGAGQRRRRRRGNVVHSSVSVLRSGALFQTYTAHNTSHRHHHQPLLYALFSELCVRSYHPTGAAETVLTNQWTVTLVSDTVVEKTTWPGASPSWLCCTWHQQWPALKTSVTPEGVVTYRSGAAVGEDWTKAVE